jgi:sodium-dependent dicarboxylate transporter 2/3/5
LRSEGPVLDNGRGRDSPVLGWIGRIAGPAAAVAVYFVLPDLAVDPAGLSAAGRATAAVGVLMAILWMTEAMPLPATALIPLALFPLLGIMPFAQTAATYAHEFIFLFIGGFTIGLAMERWALHRRIALLVLRTVGASPARIAGGFMLAAALISMWISNTATTIMMLPVGISIIRLYQERLGAGRLSDGSDGVREFRNFSAALMLGIAYAASIGGIGTIIGTLPNMFLVGFLQTTYGITVGFGRWMLVGIPLVAVFLPLAWLALTRFAFPVGARHVEGIREVIRDETAALGPMSRGERVVLAVFLATVAAWILREPLTHWPWLVGLFPGLVRLTDAGIAVIAALFLFAIPIDWRRGVFAMNWETAVRLPWGVLILFGGGLSLAAAVPATGVDAWIGRQVAGLAALPFTFLVAAVVVTVLALTELTSNTATAATFLPILGGVAVGIGMNPVMLVIPAGIAASYAFMLPVATPPNAVVFGSGYVSIGQMVRAGVYLNLIGAMLITALAHTVILWVMTG